MDDEVACQRCGGPAKEGKMLAEECCVPVEGPQKLDFAVRSFEVNCDKCGTLISQKQPIGYHSTQVEARLWTEFPKKIRTQLRSLLPESERSIFDAVMRGIRFATDEEKTRWRELRDRLRS
jgi:hypothetical protein